MTENNRNGKVAYIKYTGGILGEDPHDIREDEPLRVVIGGKRVPKGFEKALQVMNVGDRLSLIVPPEDAYGDPDPKLIKWYPKVLLKDGDKFKVNTMIMWHSDDGLAARPAMVTDETEDLLQIDLNHPYAGKTLKYELELVSLQD